MAQAIIAAAAVAGLGYSVYSGERNAKLARRARRDARTAQDKAKTQAASQRRREAEATRRASRPTPDFEELLSSLTDPSQAGNLLSGPAGVPGNALNLGQNTLLGELF